MSRDDARQKEYAQLITMNAWKDLERWVTSEVEKSMRGIDSIAAKDLSVNHVCEERGNRKGIQRVIHYAKGVAEGR